MSPSTPSLSQQSLSQRSSQSPSSGVTDTNANWPVQPDLAMRIRTRIEHRLGDRIRALTVEIIGNQIKLGGRCTTYYSKQLAQHAALGVVEDEELDNQIEVGVRR